MEKPQGCDMGVEEARRFREMVLECGQIRALELISGGVPTDISVEIVTEDGDRLVINGWSLERGQHPPEEIPLEDRRVDGHILSFGGHIAGFRYDSIPPYPMDSHDFLLGQSVFGWRLDWLWPIADDHPSMTADEVRQSCDADLLMRLKIEGMTRGYLKDRNA